MAAAHHVHSSQRAALDTLGLGAQDRAAIFAGNFERVFGGE